jgi:hypothetical protein
LTGGWGFPRTGVKLLEKKKKTKKIADIKIL